jgi:hypothetical protein
MPFQFNENAVIHRDTNAWGAYVKKTCFIRNHSVECKSTNASCKITQRKIGNASIEQHVLDNNAEKQLSKAATDV